MFKNIDRNRLYNYLYSLTTDVLNKRNIKLPKKALKSKVEDWCDTIVKNAVEVRVVNNKVIIYYKDDYTQYLELPINILK